MMELISTITAHYVVDPMTTITCAKISCGSHIESIKDVYTWCWNALVSYSGYQSRKLFK